MDSITESLFRRRAPSLVPGVLADLFSRLVWTMDDNGAEVVRIMQQWIESGDAERARVALAFDEGFLYPTRDEMVSAFNRVCARLPELRAACDVRLTAWDDQHSIR